MYDHTIQELEVRKNKISKRRMQNKKKFIE